VTQSTASSVAVIRRWGRASWRGLPWQPSRNLGNLAHRSLPNRMTSRKAYADVPTWCSSCLQ